MTIPDDFKTGILGSDLLKVGIRCAEDAGFKWPEDWQYRFTENEPFVTEGQNSMSLDATYRINPERLKPKAPRVGFIEEWLAGAPAHPSNIERVQAIELTDQVRRRLGKDAGVDTKNLTHVITTCRNVNLSSKDITSRIMELIADAAVEVKE